MLFHSVDYVLFLGIGVLGFWSLLRWPFVRSGFLWILSCLFYMAWHPAYIGLILGSTALDFVAGIRIADSKTTGARRSWLTVSLLGNLGVLGTFKYFNFASSVVGQACAALGWPVDVPLLDVLLPVGISFYTFQTMSYTVDVYRGTLAAERSPVRFALFVSYFPQLVAGPIVRASEFLPQLARTPALSKTQVGRGLFWIATGLVKKVAVADLLSVNLVDRVFGHPELYSGAEVLVALYGFTMQMYCDFSGYTDVARGSGLLMGFELPQNFDRPYGASNPAEFWRRWHMTLSRWIRDYLYFPLGGSRTGPVRAYVNLALTMFLMGLWHGASWTFVWYGLLQALAMVVHRLFHRWRVRKGLLNHPAPWVRPMGVFLCLQFVVFSRILFRAEDMDNARAVVARLMSGSWSLMQVPLWLGVLLGVAFALHYTPRRWIGSLQAWFEERRAWVQGLLLWGVGLVLARVATTEVVPYIYFQF